VAALLSIPVFRLPPLAAWTSVAFMYVTLGFVGYRIGRTKNEELFALIGMKPRAAGSPEKVFVVDTSALIDGRILAWLQPDSWRATCSCTRPCTASSRRSPTARTSVAAAVAAGAWTRSAS
jgi:hypothetical protein